MRAFGSLLIAGLAFALAIVVLVALLGLAIRLIVVAIGVALAVVAYLFAEKLVGQRR